jgi:hypothetical protein
MKQRCSNPRSPNHRNYAGRGIHVCEAWNNFETFHADMGDRPSPLHSLERIDNNSGYSPENCKWATQREQQRNTRQNRHLTLNGRTLLIVQWSEETGIPQSHISQRLKAGWSVERTLTQPVRKLRSNKI